jgi:hypothetical protein
VKVSFNFFEKFSCRPLSTCSPISSSFSVCFEWFKIWLVPWLKLYKTSFHYRGKQECNHQRFYPKILFCFNSPINEHWTSLTPKISYLPHSFIKLSNFGGLEGLGERLQTFFELQKQRNKVWWFNLLWVLKCSLASLTTLFCCWADSAEKKLAKSSYGRSQLVLHHKKKFLKHWFQHVDKI